MPSPVHFTPIRRTGEYFKRFLDLDDRRELLDRRKARKKKFGKKRKAA